MTRRYLFDLGSNSERRELGAHGVHPQICARFKLNSKRAHPPIPPRGRALTLRPRELEARARSKFALRVRQGQGKGRRRRYFPGGMASRRPREQPQSPTEFVSPVRSAPQALACPAPGRPTLARVAPGCGPPIQPPIPPTGPARANVARRSAGLFTLIPNPEARRPLP